MFAIPGIIALLVFIYLRPQEVFEAARTLPFLHVFLGLTVVGFVIDLAIRKIQAKPTPQFRWAVVFLLWAAVTMAIKVPPDRIKEQLILLLISFTLFAVIAHGVQSFRTFTLTCGVLVGVCLTLASIGAHQAYAPKQCLALDKDTPAHLGEGQPDGRGCEARVDCYGEMASPDKTYVCERVGLLATSTVQGRVRYRGVLQDPNELALVICAGLPFLFAMVGRRRSLRWYLVMAVGTVVVFVCMFKTQSRSGQLAFLAVLGVYFLKRLRWKGVALAMLMALPVLLAGGRGGQAAGQSTIDRYEAWRAGVDMVRSNPAIGVGQGMFTETHHLTAHNSYLLAGAELGLPGMFLWLMLIYLSIKIGLTGMRVQGEGPMADEARAWGTALVAALIGFLISMLFLSLTYHMVLWIYLGIAGAYYSTMRREVPGFEVRLGVADYAMVGSFSVAFLLAMSILLRIKGY